MSGTVKSCIMSALRNCIASDDKKNKKTLSLLEYAIDKVCKVHHFASQLFFLYLYIDTCIVSSPSLNETHCTLYMYIL